MMPSDWIIWLMPDKQDGVELPDGELAGEEERHNHQGWQASRHVGRQRSQQRSGTPGQARLSVEGVAVLADEHAGDSGLPANQDLQQAIDRVWPGCVADQPPDGRGLLCLHEDWLVANLHQQFVLRDEKLRRHFGAVDLGAPMGIDNRRIDADQARAYADTHQDACCCWIPQGCSAYFMRLNRSM